MAKSVLITHNVTALFIDATTYYLALGASFIDNSLLVEAEAEIPIRNAGTFRNLYTYAPSNTVSVNSVITLRKSRAGTALTVTYGADQTGVKEDTSNSVSFANTDEAAYQLAISAEAGTNNLGLSLVAVEFEPTSSTDTVSFFAYGGVGHNEATASATRFFTPVGRGNAVSVTTEANCNVEIRDSFTASRLYTYVNANARTTDTTFKSRKNSADGGQAVTYTSGQTGVKEDTSGTDALAAGDDFNFAVTTSTGTNNLGVKMICCRLVNTAGKAQIVTAEQGGQAVAFNTTRYTAIGGDIDTDTAQANSQFLPRTSLVASQMVTNVSANTIATSDTTIHLMDGGSASALTVSYTAGQTGQKSDTTNSASLEGGTDTTQHRIITPNTSGSITVQSIGILVAAAQAVAGNTIASGASLFSPTLKHVIVGAFIASAAALTPPTVSTGGQAITGAHISSGATLTAPTLKYTVAATHIASGATLNAPTLKYVVNGAHIASTASLNAPTVKYKVAGATIASGAVLFAPTLRYAVSGAHIASGATITAPTVGYRVQLPTIASGAVLSAPSVTVGAVTVSAAHIASAAALTAPTISPGAVTVVGAHKASTATLTAPTVSVGSVAVAGVHIASGASLSPPTVSPGAVSVAGAHIASAAVLGAPTVSPGAVTVTLAHIASTVAFNPPTITQGATVATVLITSTAQVFAPSVTPGEVSVAGATIPSGSTLAAPRLSYTVVLATIPAGSQVFEPSLRAVVVGATIASSASLAPPSVIAGPPTITLPHIASTAALFAPSVEGGVPLELGCMTTRSLVAAWSTACLTPDVETRSRTLELTTLCTCECEEP